MPDSGQPDLGQIHHLAYVVEEIEPAARRLHEQFGAGPFFYLEDVPVEDVTSRGEPAEFVHGSAFGICNDMPIELLKIARIEPARADERFVRNDNGTPRLQHVAYVVPRATVEAVRADLEASGLPEYLSARIGDDVDFSYHDAGATLGHDLELHADSDGLRGFFAMFREAAASWDGSDLLRPPPG
jgi:Glyoxalase/Bleomycin resistance protein/Dioxygenase superfamily